MTKYICQNCKTEITPNDLRLLPGVKCPKCSHRILIKKRSLIAKPVKAR
ncbi:MAG: DNA-directed RNA polymerase subunit P [Candidatus Heimdallarchaeum aukensis]|uniref:DNA-directed RNA polymerase subunit Rpo12 n=2 Tax=Candidatus Heimdallarchaeum TaxID=3053649 RepID=A0A9Y1BQV3_9ARCH|nr:MAG: DNA-directed RNA polymerase subunit P [Candidatus Heimdallarchaeum aukensis]UJG43518.1 MAG: DNA-directed RNA polymerase subunit P [Candidatus Heimdallarchaeum endolithica]